MRLTGGASFASLLGFASFLRIVVVVVVSDVGVVVVHFVAVVARRWGGSE